MGLEIITRESGDPIFVDVVTDSAWERSAELASYPVEDGGDRSDHKIVNADTRSLTIKQTEHPIDDPEYAMRPLEIKDVPVRTKVTSPFLLLANYLQPKVEALIDSVFNERETVRSESYQTTTPKDRGAALWDKLSELLTSDELVTVTFKGRSQPGLSLIGLSKQDTQGEGLVSTFALTFQELRTVQLETVALPDPLLLAQKPAKKQGKKKEEEKKADEVPPTSKSLLKMGIDAMRGS